MDKKFCDLDFGLGIIFGVEAYYLGLFDLLIWFWDTWTGFTISTHPYFNFDAAIH